MQDGCHRHTWPPPMPLFRLRSNRPHALRWTCMLLSSWLMYKGVKMPHKSISIDGFKTQKYKITKAQNKMVQLKWRHLSCFLLLSRSQLLLSVNQDGPNLSCPWAAAELHARWLPPSAGMPHEVWNSIPETRIVLLTQGKERSLTFDRSLVSDRDNDNLIVMKCY